MMHHEPVLEHEEMTNGVGGRTAIDIRELTHIYPPSRKQQEPRTAINDLSLRVNLPEFFCLVGPNGSGKSTLFKILSTLIAPTRGTVSILGGDLLRDRDTIRRNIGVVFQHPSLDGKLTVRENLVHQGHLYGLKGSPLRERCDKMLSQVGLLDRGGDIVETLSGGLQRRVELAKALLHQPKLLILDEPSTGLDPGARTDFTRYLGALRAHDDVTIVLTTHILEEAEHADRLAIMDKGGLVALGTPAELKREIGGDVITVTASQPADFAQAVERQFHVASQAVDGKLRIERSNGHEFIPQLIQAFPGRIEAITLSKPTLEDVFIHHTGHAFWEDRL
jgi:ABC-2 type transport system ATP-binding protein